MLEVAWISNSGSEEIPGPGEGRQGGILGDLLVRWSLGGDPGEQEGAGQGLSLSPFSVGAR